MVISGIRLKEEECGIKCFPKKASYISLGDIVVLTGSNGSGKSRLLKMISNHIDNIKNGITDNLELKIKNNFKSEDEYVLTQENVDSIKIVNYSHFDANLQLYRKFTPYVIHKAKDILKECDYEETALNALLLINDMANGYSDEFKDKKVFKSFCKELETNFNIKLREENGELKFFDFTPEKSDLSPGQIYLLRMAVACFQNVKDDRLIFFLDEPELHLHPAALLNVIKYLRKKFNKSQFWISTHSLSLIANMSLIEKNTTILYLRDGTVAPLLSNSESLIDGLIGSEDNRMALYTLISLPDIYACNKFATECYDEPPTLSAEKGDVQIGMISQVLKPGDTVIDYGAGKGRFFEGLGLDDFELASAINYYAFDEDNKDADRCKAIMNTYGSSENNYSNDFSALLGSVEDKADYVLLVNVLHEIEPKYWEKIFENIKSILKDEGVLFIVEKEILETGEGPYDEGFLMITESAAKALFGEEGIKIERHPVKNRIIKYTIPKNNLNVDGLKIKRAIELIKKDSYKNIKALKKVTNDKKYKEFKHAIQLTFWLHQYANSNLILSEEKEFD